jgi:hypothetical protein
MLGRRLANPECLLIPQRCPLVRSGRSARVRGRAVGNRALASLRAKWRFSRPFGGSGVPPPCPPPPRARFGGGRYPERGEPPPTGVSAGSGGVAGLQRDP